MPMKLAATLRHLQAILNITNKKLLVEFHDYLKEVDTSENYQNQMLIPYALFLGEKSFYDVSKKEQITEFLDTKAKSIESDPDKKWITTWNDYLWRPRLHNCNLVKERGEEPLNVSEWKTPSFAIIKKKKTKGRLEIVLHKTSKSANRLLGLTLFNSTYFDSTF